MTLSNITRRPPIVAHFPNGVWKLYCPCGAIVVCNPAQTDLAPAQCHFCTRRLDWGHAPNPSQDPTLSEQHEHGRIAVRQKTAQIRESPYSRAPLVAICPKCWESEPCRCEQQRTLERASPWDYLYTMVAPPAPERQGLFRMLPSHDGGTSSCNHGPEQMGGRRCVRCCVTKGLTYVWRKAAGGAAGGWRWLCQSCELEYRRLGLVEGARQYGRAQEPADLGASA